MYPHRANAYAYINLHRLAQTHFLYCMPHTLVHDRCTRTPRVTSIRFFAHLLCFFFRWLQFLTLVFLSVSLLSFSRAAALYQHGIICIISIGLLVHTTYIHVHIYPCAYIHTHRIYVYARLQTLALAAHPLRLLLSPPIQY